MRMIFGVAALGLLSACNAEAPVGNSDTSVNAAVQANATMGTNAAAAPLGSAVSGEEAKAVMHERHEGMEHIGKATKTIGRELKSANPDLAKIRDAADTIADLSTKSGGWFRPGTGPDVGKTGAKPEIWQNATDVEQKDRAFQEAAQAFNAAAATGDLTKIKDSFADLGKTCKACHDDYRAEMKH